MDLITTVHELLDTFSADEIIDTVTLVDAERARIAALEDTQPSEPTEEVELDDSNRI